MDKKIIIKYVVNILEQKSIKYDIHNFDSGAVMVDIWYKNLWYVIQIDDDSIGLSKNDDNPAFTSKPDELFKSEEEFKKKFELLFR
ncbi:MAG: hypothetical protein Q8R82_14305 [Hyphomonadaceae bacterium]|nr:hypothetical protein [Hyphomonadaceae bacterium]